MHNQEQNAVNLVPDWIVDLQLNAVPTMELLPALDQAARGEGMICSCCPNNLTPVVLRPPSTELLGQTFGLEWPD